MALSTTEKVLLANQYEILRRLDSSKGQDYELLLTCLYEGYDYDYEQLLPHFEEPLQETVRAEVREILEMFRALYPPRHAAHNVQAPAVFAGFDGNEETEHYAYARFLIEGRHLWIESKPTDYNTHTPVLPQYRRMLKEWNRSASNYNLSEDDVARIVAVAPNLSTRGMPELAQQEA